MRIAPVSRMRFSVSILTAAGAEAAAGAVAAGAAAGAAVGAGAVLFWAVAAKATTHSAPATS